MCGYRYSLGGTNVSLIVRGEAQRIRFHIEPALSFVPEARAPPKGCWPTTAPVGLSLTYRFPAAYWSAAPASSIAARSRAITAPVWPTGAVETASSHVTSHMASG